MIGTAVKAEMRACSACAGDYEDPDRTAWAPEDTDGQEREEALDASAGEFPAKE